MSHSNTDTQPNGSVAPVAPSPVGKNPNRLYRTSPDKPFDLALPLAEARDEGVYDSPYTLVVKVGDIEGRAAQIWSTADVPLIGKMEGRTFWDGTIKPYAMMMTRLDDADLPKPYPLVFVVRRDHETVDFTALLVHMVESGLPTDASRYEALPRSEGEVALSFVGLAFLDTFPG